MRLLSTWTLDRKSRSPGLADTTALVGAPGVGGDDAPSASAANAAAGSPGALREEEDSNALARGVLLQLLLPYVEPQARARRNAKDDETAIAL